MKVGFIELGQMGRAMACNILKAGHELIVWNRSPARPMRWWRPRAMLVATLAAAAQGEW